MPYSIETGSFCESWYAANEIPGSKGRTYRVTINGAEDYPHCTCPAFTYHKNGFEDDYTHPRCKHIERVFKEACLYNCQWHEGNKEVKLLPIEVHYSPRLAEKCPNCGGDTVPVRIAV